MNKIAGKRVVESLNGMLAHAHACIIRYAMHAVAAGPHSEAVSAHLRGIASDEVSHAKKLRMHITTLGGTPTMKVQADDLKPALQLQEILELNIAEERVAITAYRKILRSIPSMNTGLFEGVRDILVKQREHLRELESLTQFAGH